MVGGWVGRGKIIFWTTKALKKALIICFTSSCSYNMLQNKQKMNNTQFKCDSLAKCIKSNNLLKPINLKLFKLNKYLVRNLHFAFI